MEVLILGTGVNAIYEVRDEVVATRVESLEVTEDGEQHSTFHESQCCCHLQGIAVFAQAIQERHTATQDGILLPLAVELIGSNTHDFVANLVERCMAAQLYVGKAGTHADDLWAREH